MKTYLNKIILISIILVMPHIFGAKFPILDTERLAFNPNTLEAQFPERLTFNPNILETQFPILDGEKLDFNPEKKADGDKAFIKNYEAKLAIALEAKDFSRLAKLSYKITQNIGTKREYQIDNTSKLFIYLLTEIMQIGIEELKSEITKPTLFSTFADEIAKALPIAYLLINNYKKSQSISLKQIDEINELINIQELLERFVREKQFVFTDILYNLELIEKEQILKAIQFFYMETYEQFVKKLKAVELGKEECQLILSHINIQLQNTKIMNLNTIIEAIGFLSEQKFVLFRYNISPFESYEIVLQVWDTLNILKGLILLHEQYDDSFESIDSDESVDSMDEQIN